MVHVKEKEAPKVQRGLCRHHWVIDTPSGPLSQGVCSLCGENRSFKNYLDNTYVEDVWTDDSRIKKIFSNTIADAEESAD